MGMHITVKMVVDGNTTTMDLKVDIMELEVTEKAMG